MHDDDKRMNHDVMKRASERPLSGPGATDTVAASGGLERPGHVGLGNSADQQADRADAERMPPPTATSVEKIEREHRKKEER